MINKLIIWGIILLLPTFAFSNGLEKDALVLKVIAASGMDSMIESIPQQFEAQHIQRKTTAKNPEAEELVTRLFLESFNDSRAKEVLNKTIQENTSLDNLQKIVAWLDSPLGMRLSLAEVNAASPSSQADMLRYVADLQSNPPVQDRIIVIQKFEESARLTDSTIKMLKLIMRGMLSGIQKASPENEKISEEELNTQLDSMIPMMKQMLWQQMLVMSHFVYQEFTVEEIEEYIAFLKTEEGTQYIQLSVLGFSAVFSDLMNAVMPKIIDAAAIIKASSKETS